MARKNMYVKEMEPANKRARTGVTSFAPGASYGPAAAGYRVSSCAPIRQGYTHTHASDSTLEFFVCTASLRH